MGCSKEGTMMRDDAPQTPRGSEAGQQQQLSDIKEIRKLVVQSLNVANALDISLRALNTKVNQKDKSELNKSFFLLVLLGVVIVLSFFFYFRAEVTHFKEKLGTAAKQNEYLQKDIKELKDRLATSENTDIKAFNLYLAFKEGDPDQAIKRYAEFNLSALSRLERFVIETEVNLIKQKAAINKYEEGVTLFNRKSYLAAVERFEESLKISGVGKHVPSLFYYTSTAYYRANEIEKAAIAFERFLFVNTEKGLTKDKAELLLGVCYERMKQYERAVNFYQQVLKDNKYSRFGPTIRDRMRNLQKKIEKQKNMEDKRSS